jgi:hypothetical protein
MPRFPPKTLNLFSNKSKFDDAVLQKRLHELQLFMRELLSFEVFAKSAILLDWLQASNEVSRVSFRMSCLIVLLAHRRRAAQCRRRLIL